MNKLCPTCDIPKLTTEFRRDKYTVDGFTFQCKDCRKRYSPTPKQQAASRKKHLPKRQKECRDYYTQHRDNLLQNVKDYQQTPQGRYSSYRKGAAARELAFDITFDEFMSFWQKHCTYCHDTIETIGLDRIDNTKGYCLANVVPCCALCNYTRSNRFTYEAMTKEIGPAIQRVREVRS